jgi:GT2 family glycosyltransferase
MTISVIIPTYNRLNLLIETLDSVFKQTVLPDEILIGDNSTDTKTEEYVHNVLFKNALIPIVYKRHIPSLHPFQNVEYLINQATGDTIFLIHDDDLIYPNCLEDLKTPLENNPEVIASFGDQILIKNNGEEIPGSDITLNDKYHRTKTKKGIVNGKMAAIVQMFPNNSFLVRSDIAKKIGYYGNNRGGDAGDFYFGFRLGLEGNFYYIKKLVAKYRITETSITSNPNLDHAYRILKILLEDLTKEELNQDLYKQRINHIIHTAISQAIKHKDKKTAIRWMMSPFYRDKIFTLRGLKRIGLLLLN